MRVNGDHERFKMDGERNRSYETGQLQSIVERLVLEIEMNAGNPEEYVEQLKKQGVLED